MSVPDTARAAGSPALPDGASTAHRWRMPPAEARAAGTLCAVAGLAHLLVAPEHLGEWAPAGIFFLVVAAAQLWLGQALWRRTTVRVLPAAVLATAGLVALYVVSRTVGLPLPPHEGVPTGGGHHGSPVPGAHGSGVPVIPGSEPLSAVEAVGLLDLVCVVAELGALALLVGMLPAERRRTVTNLLLAVGVCGWVVWAVRSR